jgi:hypothetical protein
MKITVFTSNQPRHLSLVEDLASISSEVYAVIEGNTVFPGQLPDFYKKTEVMQQYFQKMMAAEKEVFGEVRFLPKNVRTLSLKSGDLSFVPMKQLEDALHSDLYIIFGASYIRGPLIDFLVSQKAYNIHMGTSPYYRGSACNFWAAYDKNFDYVGATIHMLSKGLDSGDMLFHAFPEQCDEAFLLGMKAVKSAHKGLIEYITSGKLDKITPVKQDKSLQIKYSKGNEFNDEVASDYLQHLPTAEMLKNKLSNRDLSKFLNPYIG